MASLSSCLLEHQPSAYMTARLKTLAGAYKGDPLAHVKAAEDMMVELKAERTDLIGQIEKQGGTVPKPKAAEPKTAAEPTGAPPSPKERAAKTAALLKAASSSDPALLNELATTTDAKSLQRALAVLPPGKAQETALARMRELIQVPGVAYGLQTKKYSLQSEVIHASLGRPGFAATHDSPIKHEGKFDWRTHAMKGEGAMVKGAGTYLSTSDAVHGYYKKAFTSKTSKDATIDRMPFADQFKSSEPALYEKLKLAAEANLVLGVRTAQDMHDAFRSIADAFGELMPDDLAELGISQANVAEAQRIADLAQRATESDFEYTLAGEVNSPTYHLSVDIEPEQLMDWDKPLSQQSETVQAAALKAIKARDLRDAGPDKTWAQGAEDIWYTTNTDIDYQIEQTGPTKFTLYAGRDTANGRSVDILGTFDSLAKAQAAANQTTGLDTRGDDFYRALSDSFAEGNRDVGDSKASDYLQSLGILGHRMKAAAKDGNQNPNYVIYDDSKIHTNYVHFDKTKTTPGKQGPVDRKAVQDYIEKVLGPKVGVAWANIFHAGEFERTPMGDLIRLSVHSLNPMSTAYHEALHGLFARLNDAKQGDIRAVLEKAGDSAHVMAQLKKLLANEPGALAQLTDPEERAAYMYQFWALGKLQVGPQVTTFFQKIAKFLREVTGLWTNDERAEKIMEYFHGGEFEKNRNDPNAVHRALMSNGLSGAVAQAKTMTQPLREMGEALASAGGTRLRDSGIPALRELADAMKLKTTSEGKDPGFLPASRAERSRMMNQLGADLKGYTPEQLRAALEQLQSGVKATDTGAQAAAARVSQRLQQALVYLKAAGVDITALGMQDGVPYFPRSWDASYISSHQKEFLAMTEKYVRSGQWKGNPKSTMEKLMVTDGAEFGVEVDKPGMQQSKQRVLSFVSHADAAPFMRKDLYQIMNSYYTQATRRAEWARRFGDDGKGVTDLILKAAKQGATAEQLKGARQFVRAVDGTLGDGIDPNTRRLMGNMMVYQNIRLLPLAIFSSLVDPGGIAVRGGTVGDAFKAFKRGMKETVKNFQKAPTQDWATDLAEAIGTIDSATLVHTLGASYQQGMVGDTGREINDTFFRWNLMEQFNRSMRVSATEAAMSFLGRHAKRPGQHSKRYFNELGLDASDVQFTADGRVKMLESDGLTMEQSAKMKAAVNRWVDGAVLRPDAVDKPVWMSDPYFSLVAHLKQFVYSFHETILKRVMHEFKHGNYAPAMALASYVPAMIAADMIKGVIQGGGEEPAWKKGWGVEDYVWSGMERAGLFGVGQFGIDAMQGVERGGAMGLFNSLSGPTIEQLTGAVEVMGGRKEFGSFALKSLPANALYAGLASGETPDPKFDE